MRAFVIAMFMAASILAAANAALAGGDAAAAAGLIKEHCARCHLVPGYESLKEHGSVIAPDFLYIARNPRVYTPPRLRGFLRQPHWPMTRFTLSSEDIDNILAFIEELR